MTYRELWELFGDMIPESLLKDVKPESWNPIIENEKE